MTRSTDREISGSDYKLWTTLKVPQGESSRNMPKFSGASPEPHEFVLMPANGIFALGVGHVRRKSMEPGARSDEPAEMTTTNPVELDAEEWEVLLAIKEELKPEEICEDPWGPARMPSDSIASASFKLRKPLIARRPSAFFFSLSSSTSSRANRASA